MQQEALGIEVVAVHVLVVPGQRDRFVRLQGEAEDGTSHRTDLGPFVSVDLTTVFEHIASMSRRLDRDSSARVTVSDIDGWLTRLRRHDLLIEDRDFAWDDKIGPGPNAVFRPATREPNP